MCKDIADTARSCVRNPSPYLFHRTLTDTQKACTETLSGPADIGPRSSSGGSMPSCRASGARTGFAFVPSTRKHMRPVLVIVTRGSPDIWVRLASCRLRDRPNSSCRKAFPNFTRLVSCCEAAAIASPRRSPEAPRHGAALRAWAAMFRSTIVDFIFQR